MPNWVYNQVSVTGPTEDVQRLKEQVGAVYTQTVTTARSMDEDGTWTSTTEEVENTDDFSFWNIVRPPEDKLDLYRAISNGSEDKTWGWYNWNCANWGTKWDASDVHRNEIAPDHVQWTFSTAWSTPHEVLDTLSRQYPTCTITNQWEEEQGFGGTVEHERGAASILDEYDVPATHEEMVARKQYCYCEDDEDPDDHPFHDCPRDDNPLGIPTNEVEMEAAI